MDSFQARTVGEAPVVEKLPADEGREDSCVYKMNGTERMGRSARSRQWL